MPARPDPEGEHDPVLPDATLSDGQREDLAGPGPAGAELVGGDGNLTPNDDQPGGPPTGSGLRNPDAAVRGVGAGALIIEAVVLLLAIVPLVKLGHPTAVVVSVLLGLVALCVALAGLLRYRWAWWAGAGLQVLLFAGGLLHVALAILGVLFGAVWAYVLSVRRSVLG